MRWFFSFASLGYKTVYLRTVGHVNGSNIRGTLIIIASHRITSTINITWTVCTHTQRSLLAVNWVSILFVVRYSSSICFFFYTNFYRSIQIRNTSFKLFEHWNCSRCFDETTGKFFPLLFLEKCICNCFGFETIEILEFYF